MLVSPSAMICSTRNLKYCAHYQRKKLVLFCFILIAIAFYIFSRNDNSLCNRLLPSEFLRPTSPFSWELLGLIKGQQAQTILQCEKLPRKFIGPLCQKLCQHSHNGGIRCLRATEAGKAVMSITHKGQLMVLKVDERSLGVGDDGGIRKQLESLAISAAEEMLFQLIMAYIPKVWPDDRSTRARLNSVWQTQIKPSNSDHIIPVMLNTLELFQQREFSLTVVLQDLHISPQLLGICGTMYTLEHAPPDPSFLSNRISAGIPYMGVGTWDHRAELAVKLLELLIKLEKHSLNLCDVKGDNFGLTHHGSVVAIDLDSVFLDEELSRELESKKLCFSDEDCNFWDCKGKCDLEKKSCTGERINNNLQAVCEKIFKHHSDNGYHGLLTNPPHDKKPLSDLLDNILSRHMVHGKSEGDQMSDQAEMINKLLKLLH